MSAPPDRTPRLDDTELVEALASSRRLGMLGRAPLTEVIDHSAVFVDALGDVSGTVVDLGSGGGVPGLVIAWVRADLRLVLVDRRTTRTDHLRRLVHRLGRQEQITVVAGEARALPTQFEHPVDAVVARSFGPPAAVLEAATPIMAAHAIVVVSAPPDDPSAKWPTSLLTRFDLVMRPADRRVVVMARPDVSR